MHLALVESERGKLLLGQTEPDLAAARNVSLVLGQKLDNVGGQHENERCDVSDGARGARVDVRQVLKLVGGPFGDCADGFLWPALGLLQNALEDFRHKDLPHHVGVETLEDEGGISVTGLGATGVRNGFGLGSLLGLRLRPKHRVEKSHRQEQMEARSGVL
jgi:hypothetical protein